MQMPVSLADADIPESEIDHIVANLEAHGRTALGEHADITIDESREILFACALIHLAGRTSYYLGVRLSRPPT